MTDETVLSSPVSPTPPDQTVLSTPVPPAFADDATTLGTPPSAPPAPPTQGMADDRTALSNGSLGAPSSVEEATILASPPPARRTGGAEGPLELGQAFGRRYHIIKLLGLGGMGAVYQAWDAELGTSVAIKVIRPEAAASRDAAADLERRFKRELLLARQVTHKNVVRIHDLGEIDGIKYITMPFVDGEDVASVLKREGRLPVPRVLRIARNVVAGLVAAHDAGIVHRDLKPANIMVDANDEALIMDFGIARSTSAPVVPTTPGGTPVGLPAVVPLKPHETTLGSVVGTLEYMAPEQARGQAVDQRADIYALGLILRDMLLGRARVSGPADTMPELQRRMETAPPPPRSVDASIPERVDRLVAKCLPPDPADRFQTTREIAEELDRLDANGLPLPVHRRVTPRLAASVAVLFAALLTGVWWISSSQPAVQPSDPVPVLIADFVNGPKDPAFGGALEQALGIAIEGASFITVYPRRDALRVANELRPGGPLDEDGARLVALREGVKVVLAGAIEARRSGYTISVKVIDPATPEPLTTATATASDANGVLEAVGSLSARIRRALGDVEPDSGGAETLTSSSLEAVRLYSQAQDLAQNGKDADAVELYQKAIAIDPNFGRAYSGLATSAFKLGREAEAEEAWNKALSLMDRMSDRERLRTQGTYFLGRAKNYDKAIDNFEQLVNRYPADGAGHNNLAVAYFNRLQFDKAVEEGRRIRDIYPKKLLYRGNLALYAMYAGDFATATTQAKDVIAEDPGYVKGYLPLAVAAILDGSAQAARDAYAQMAVASPIGASLAAAGLADQASYEGRFQVAETMLKASIKQDEQAKTTRSLAAKYIALGEVYAATGRRALAVDAATKAVAVSRDYQFPAAMVLVDVGEDKKAAEIAEQLGGQLQPQSRAFAKIIEGRVALRARKTVEGVEALQEAIKLADFWLARYHLGIAFVQAGYAPEGQAELDRCQQRRGEATAVYLDDVPTVRVLVPLKYWLARAQEGVGQRAAAVTNYEAFLALRSASDDPLVRDAKKRMQSLK